MDLQSLKEDWEHTIHHEGGTCPVCDRWGKVYGRTINMTMARSLIWLCREASKNISEWVDVPNTAPRSVIRTNQLPTLAWWGLVERCPKNDANKTKYSGLWRPTEKGWKFYRGQINVPHKVFTYNNEVEGFSDNLVFINECFETMFDYQEVMSSNFDD
jgi:hypothetical protein